MPRLLDPMFDLPVIILGANGNCLDIAEAVEAAGDRVVAGFLDDDPALEPGAMMGAWPLLGRIHDAPGFPNAGFVCGIGSPRSFREKAGVIERAGIPADRWATVVHPSAVVSRFATLEPGCVVLSHCSIGARARLGRWCTLLQGCVISHDAELGERSILASRVCLSGGSRIGEGSYLGCGVCVRDGVRVGAGALIGMGAVVVRDIPGYCTAFGAPARVRP